MHRTLRWVSRPNYFRICFIYVVYGKEVHTFSILILCTSSCNYLEYDESDFLEKDAVFSSFQYTRDFLTNIYSYVPAAFGTIGGDALRSAACDEAVYVDKLSPVHSFNNRTKCGRNIRVYISQEIPGILETREYCIFFQEIRFIIFQIITRTGTKNQYAKYQ